MTRPATLSVPDALIEAGLQLLQQDDGQGLTLRRAAAQAGVSHAAPAHHFGSLAGLQTAIAARGFAQVRESLGRIMDRQRPDAPFETLLAVGTGYLDFAHRNPALFRLMFLRIRQADDRLRTEAASAWTIVTRVVQPLLAGRDPSVLQTALWALTHGYAMLGLGHPRPNAPAPAADYAQVLRALLMTA